MVYKNNGNMARRQMTEQMLENEKSRYSVNCSLQICCKFNAVTWNFPSK